MDHHETKKMRVESASSDKAEVTPTALPGSAADVAVYEQKYVHDVYSAIAVHFSATRYKAWPRVSGFLEGLPAGAFIADVGCGNGKYFAAAQRRSTDTLSSSTSCGEVEREGAPLLTSSHSAPSIPTHRYVVGLDYSEALLRSTQRSFVDPNTHREQPRRHQPNRRSRGRQAATVTPVSEELLPRTDTVRCDALRCPLRDGLFDAAISIAVIHHYASRERRVQAVRELLRLVRPHGGLVLVYVWARGEECTAKHAVDLETGDSLVPWECHQKFNPAHQVFHRYYHFFAEGELEELCAEAAEGGQGGGAIPITVRESYFDKENWCILVERT